MAEREFNVEVVGVEYVCDACSKGTMQFNPCSRDEPLLRLMFPRADRHWHTCNSCGHSGYLEGVYPTQKWRRVDQQHARRAREGESAMVEQIMNAKEEAQQRICEVLQDLERKTGAKVASIELRQNRNAGLVGASMGYTVLSVDLDLRF